MRNGISSSTTSNAETLPIESIREDIPEDATIEVTELYLTEVPPQPIGGFAAIQKKLKYREKLVLKE